MTVIRGPCKIMGLLRNITMRSVQWFREEKLLDSQRFVSVLAAAAVRKDFQQSPGGQKMKESYPGMETSGPLVAASLCQVLNHSAMVAGAIQDKLGLTNLDFGSVGRFVVCELEVQPGGQRKNCHSCCVQVSKDHSFPVDESSDSTKDGRDDYSDKIKKIPIIVAAAVASLTGSEHDEEEEDQIQDVITVDDDNNSLVPVGGEGEGVNGVGVVEGVQAVGLENRRRKFESPVWEFAERIGNDKARCKLCHKDFACPGSNTSNIRDHILNKHSNSEEALKLRKNIEENAASKKQKKDMKKAKSNACGVQNSITNFFSCSQIAKKDKKDIDDGVLEYLICDNESFETVESHFFRQMLFKANKSYVVPSRQTITRKIDEKINKVKKDLKEEINKDIENLKCISITSDGGNSGDIFKTKKNTITVSRVTEDFELKTDTVAVPVAKGSQEGVVIRSQWKEELLKIGYTDDWSVNVTTDGAANFRSARMVGRHHDVGLMTKYTTDCVDHQIHLLIEESLRNQAAMKASIKKGKKLINHFSRSSLSRQLLRSIQTELGLPELCPVIGTANRWFHKMSETERLLQLKVSAEVFQDRNTREISDEDDEPIEDIVDNDWELMQDYVNAVKPFQVLSKFLGGEKYPSACSVIPALDQIKDDIQTLEDGSGDAGKAFVRSLIANFDKRFDNCWKGKSPFNCLTFLDPRYLDMYADTEELMHKVKNDIFNDQVYDREIISPPPAEANISNMTDDLGGLGRVECVNPLQVQPGESIAGPSQGISLGSEREQGASMGRTLSARRAALLQKKQAQPTAPDYTPLTLRQKMDIEIERYQD